MSNKVGGGGLEMRRREVQGNAFLTFSTSCVKVMGREQPLLERAAGEAASLQGNDLMCVCVCVCVFTSREWERGGKREKARNFKPENVI